MYRAVTFIVACVLSASALAGDLTVSAAVSLKESLQAIAADYQAQTGQKVIFNFGASGQLATQIQQGAPVDLFISAASKQVDSLAKADLVVEGSRRIVASNALVLIVPPNLPIKVAAFEQLASPEVKRIAIGSPKSVPAGEYATQTLSAMNLTDVVKDRLVEGSSVRQVLDYVVRGEVDAGLVYATDAREAGDKVRVVAIAPETSHKPIVYPAVALKASPRQEEAARFLAYLQTPKAQAILTDHGFRVPPANDPATPR